MRDLHDLFRKISTFLVIIMCVTMMFPFVTFAKKEAVAAETGVTYEDSRSSSSWLNGQDADGVYGDAGDMDLTVEMDEDEKPGVFESLFITLVKALANGINNILTKGNITLDSIIMGRVDGHGVAIQSEQLGNHVVALFTFELMKGNIFGIISANVYAILRSIVYIIILCAVFAKIVAAGWKGDGAKAMTMFKSAFGEMIIVFLMLQMMPYIIDLIFYIRDVILHFLHGGLVSGMGLDMAEVSGISDVFKDLADKGILNALMYLGSSVITVWFMFQYIGLALTYCIYFFCFPFVCVNSLFAKNELVEWWKSVIGYALVPVGDFVLLFIPVAFGLIGSGFTVSVIQFCVCAMLIPARSVLRAAMGIRSNFAMELAAMGALGGAARMARGTVRAFGKTAAGVAGGVADLRKGEMFSQASSDGVSLSSGGMSLELTPSLDGGMRHGKSSNYTGSRFSYESAAQQTILNRNVNPSNFEEPEFRNISDDKRAAMYRKRGMQKLAGGILGGAAGMTGAALGAGAGMFMGANNVGELAGGLAESGTQAGQSVVEYGAGAYRELGDFGQNIYDAVRRHSKNYVPGYGTAGREPRFGSYSRIMSQDHPKYSHQMNAESVSAGDGIIPEVIGDSDINAMYESAMDWNNTDFMSFVNDEYDAVSGDDVSYPGGPAKLAEFNRRMEKHATDLCMDAFDQAYPGVDSGLRSIQEGVIGQKFRATYTGDHGNNRWVQVAELHGDKNAGRFEFK